MKRTFKYALTAVLVSAIAGSAFAQSTNFPDVPENHWAYEALARMKKEGLLMGYPNGLYIGARPATRYELAVAMHAVWINLKTVTDGLETQLKTLEDKVNNMGPGKDNSADIANLKAAIDQLRSDMASMKGWGDDIAALKKASSEFEAEFKSMHVDIDAMRKTLADYGDRISALERNQLPFTVSGDVNFIGLGGYGRDGNFGLDSDGRLNGVPRGRGGAGVLNQNPVGANKDLTFLHELGINIKSRDNAAGPQWGVSAVVEDTTGGNAFGNMATTPKGFTQQGGVIPGGYIEGGEFLDIQRAWVKFNSSLASLNFGATVGRQGMKISPLIYQRPNPVADVYNNDRWSNGEWTFDGASVNFGVGPAKIGIFGGRTANNTGFGGGDMPVGSFGGSLQPLTAGRIVGGAAPTVFGGYTGGIAQIDQQLGVTAGIPLGDKGSVNLAYLWLNSDTFNNVNPNVTPDGVRVWGGDVKFKAEGFGLWGSYAKSESYIGSQKLNTPHDDAWMAAISKDIDRVGVKIGYENIGTNFGAPGDWGKVGDLGNLTDVKGITADVHFDLTPNLSIMGSGKWLTGTGDFNAIGSGNVPFGLQTNDHLDNYSIGLGYKIGSSYDVLLGYEALQAKGPSIENGNNGKPFFHWYNIGFGWNVSDNAKLRFLWQISDADGKGSPYFADQAAVFKGGLIATQFSVKF